jgi:hypothetical protein
LSKGGLNQKEIDDMKQKYETGMAAIETYRRQIGDFYKKPIIDGNRVKEIMKEMVPDIEQHPFISIKNGNLHYLKYAIDKIIEQQQMLKIKTKEDAENFVRKNAKGWGNMRKKNLPTRNAKTQISKIPHPLKKSTQNWYKKLFLK